MVHDTAKGLLNVARWVLKSRANGPGERFVLWLQGCGLGCEGCWNPDTWAYAPRRLLSVSDVIQLVLSTHGIEGVTLTGGEPFAQASALVPLVRRIREMGLSIVVFTGHDLGELHNPAARDVLASVDLLVTGRFLISERDLSLPLRGSRNQQLVFLTNRYRDEDVQDRAEVEIHIDGVGGLAVTGFPPDELLESRSQPLRRA